jgi:HAMP domain-containing protein
MESIGVGLTLIGIGLMLLAILRPAATMRLERRVTELERQQHKHVIEGE